MDIFEKYFKGFLRTMRIFGRVLFSGIYMNILQELSEFQRIFLRIYRATIGDFLRIFGLY